MVCDGNPFESHLGPNQELRRCTAPTGQDLCARPGPNIVGGCPNASTGRGWCSPATRPLRVTAASMSFRDRMAASASRSFVGIRKIWAHGRRWPTFPAAPSPPRTRPGRPPPRPCRGSLGSCRVGDQPVTAHHRRARRPGRLDTDGFPGERAPHLSAVDTDKTFGREDTTSGPHTDGRRRVPDVPVGVGPGVHQTPLPDAFEEPRIVEFIG
jgi:hypothetical protein